jgi:ferredoxin, 2Fe-2S
MTKITFIDTAGNHHVVDALVGSSVMQAAKDHDVPGILADCGGACACATCHVIIAPEWAGRVPPPGDLELQMLDIALNREANSRLSCQIRIDQDLDGLVVTVASDQ